MTPSNNENPERGEISPKDSGHPPKNQTETPVDSTAEEAYWREHYRGRDYADLDQPFEAFAPAYRIGAEGYRRYYDKGMSYEQAEPELQREYERLRDKQHLDWEKARPAARDAWHRVEKAVPEPSAPE